MTSILVKVGIQLNFRFKSKKWSEMRVRSIKHGKIDVFWHFWQLFFASCMLLKDKSWFRLHLFKFWSSLWGFNPAEALWAMT